VRRHHDDPLNAAFVILIIFGLRRGEALGLSWADVDFEVGIITIRQQLQRIRGELHLGPVKTSAGNRVLPLLDMARDPLKVQADRQNSYLDDMGSAWPLTALVFTTRTGRPIEPRNLVRSFRRICEANGIRIIKIHHLRHIVATLLKTLDVPARDAQAVLGHSRISTTQEIYTDVDAVARRDALTKLHGVLAQDDPERPAATNGSYNPTETDLD
jgi:integrase